MSPIETPRVFTLAELGYNDFTQEGFSDELLTEFKTLLQNSGQFSGTIIMISNPTKINDNRFELQVLYNIWCPIRETEGQSMVKCQIHRNGEIVNPIYGLY